MMVQVILPPVIDVEPRAGRARATLGVRLCEWALLIAPWMTDWEASFVLGMGEIWKTDRALSVKQWAALQRSVSAIQLRQDMYKRRLDAWLSVAQRPLPPRPSHLAVASPMPFSAVRQLRWTAARDGKQAQS
jgi:hypothetical protein